MTRLPASLLAAPVLLAAFAPVPLAAQEQSGTFTLPVPTPTPTPAPAGPADERAGIAIPPRAVPSPVPSPVPTPAPQPRPTASPRALATPILQPSPTPTQAQRPPVAAPGPEDTPAPSLAAPAPEAAPQPDGSETAGLPDASVDPTVQSLPSDEAPLTPFGTAEELFGNSALPAWWPFAAGGLGALVLLGGGLLWRRRRKLKPARLAAPIAAAAGPDIADEEPRLDLTLDIIAATRSVMMFTVEYRLTIANRSERAVTDVSAALQLACARASAGNGASPGAAQSLAQIARVGPHQSRSVTGTAQLPLSAIQPLRQGLTPLFIPLAHVTLEGTGLRAASKSFVVGTRSSAGRVQPILLDQPPGAVAGLVAQPIALSPGSDAVSRKD